MDTFLASINQWLGPWASSRLGHALIGLAILVIGLIIVGFIARLFRRLFERVNLLERYNLARPLASLIKAVLTLFLSHQGPGTKTIYEFCDCPLKI